MGIAHALHHQLLVAEIATAEIATAIGADPVPFPDDLDGGGSA